MTHSEAINEIATALAKAQAAIEGAIKDKKNPHLQSTDADLSSVWDACRKPLADNGLSVAQGSEVIDGRVAVTTMLMHTSGQWLQNVLSLRPTKDDPQGIGSCITYARRYSLSSMVGVAPADDDAEAASAPASTKQDVTRPTRTSPAAKGPKSVERPKPVAISMAPAPVSVHVYEEHHEEHEDDGPITQAEAAAFWVEVRDAGWATEDMAEWLKSTYAKTTTMALTKGELRRAAARLSKP